MQGLFLFERLRNLLSHCELGASRKAWRELGHNWFWKLLATPMCFLMAIYASFVYGLVFLYVIRGPSPFELYLTHRQIFFSIPDWIWGKPWMESSGCVSTAVVYIDWVCDLNQDFYIRYLKTNREKWVPEARLPVMIGSFSLAAGLVTFDWISPANIHQIGTCVGGVLWWELGF